MRKMWWSCELRWPCSLLPLPNPNHAFCSYSSSSSFLTGRRKTTTTTTIRFDKKQVLKVKVKASKQEEEEEYRVLTSIQSRYNHIVILDTPNSTLLLLDRTNNVHSMFNKSTKWTSSYWDEFAALPPIIPQGPIAIFGLGGGTAAHLMLHLWPSLQLQGWEIDDILIDKSRDYLGLCDLEKHTVDGGILNVHIGDVFSPATAISGGYAGIIVDLFADGKVLPQLEQVLVVTELRILPEFSLSTADTWLELYDKLMPNGRFMVNCGAGGDRLPGTGHAVSQQDDSSADVTWKLNATIKALCKAFPGQVNWKKMPKSAGENYLALTGSLPDLTAWSAALPDELSSRVEQWRSCNMHDS